MRTLIIALSLLSFSVKARCTVDVFKMKNVVMNGVSDEACVQIRKAYKLINDQYDLLVAYQASELVLRADLEASKQLNKELLLNH